VCVLAATGLLCAVGLADDAWRLRGRHKLLGQVLAVSLLVGSGLVIGRVRLFGVDIELGVTAIPFTMFWLLGAINAMNLIDGMDGLASTVGGTIGLGLCAMAAMTGHQDEALVAAALVGALAGFLVWNRPPARVYLGDAGSYLIGTALAVMFADATQHGSSVISGAVLFVGVPVGDTVVAIVRRMRARRPVLRGDRGHVYDQLVDRGWSLEASVLACAAVQIVLTAVGIGVASLASTPAITLTAATISCVGIAALAAFTSPRSWAPER
jgi:UDP-GlcNAc:undecaprenyl-phosphate GlcNAc-1-phosphate transferase